MFVDYEHDKYTNPKNREDRSPKAQYVYYKLQHGKGRIEQRKKPTKLVHENPTREEIMKTHMFDTTLSSILKREQHIIENENMLCGRKGRNQNAENEESPASLV